jgi:hypothetical protein
VAARLRALDARARRELRDRAYRYLWGLPAALVIGLGLTAAVPDLAGHAGGALVLILLVFGFLVTAAAAVLAVVLEDWRLVGVWVGGLAVLFAPLPARAWFGLAWILVAGGLTVRWFVLERHRGSG